MYAWWRTRACDMAMQTLDAGSRRYGKHEGGNVGPLSSVGSLFILVLIQPGAFDADSRGLRWLAA